MDADRIANGLLSEFKRQVEERKAAAKTGEAIKFGYVDDSDFPSVVTLDGDFDFTALANAIARELGA